MSRIKPIAMLVVLAAVTAACVPYEPVADSGPFESVDVGGGHTTTAAAFVLSDKNGFGPTFLVVQTFNDEGHLTGQESASGRGSTDIGLSSVAPALVGGVLGVLAAGNMPQDINNNINTSNSNSNSNSSSAAQVQFTQAQITVLNACKPVTVGGQTWMLQTCGAP